MHPTPGPAHPLKPSADPAAPEPPAPGSRLFFVGIGGVSMAGLAEMARAAGFRPMGSDRHGSDRTRHLESLGIPVVEGHRADTVDAFRPDLLVYSAAVPRDNPERIRAGELGIPAVDRATFLGWLNLGYERVLNVAGTHGKTTTTAMAALVLMESGQDPSVHLGAEMADFHGTVRLGKPGGVLVSEACEYTGSFLRFHSTTAVVLNIDYDHVDTFPNMEAVVDAFVAFADRLPDGGLLVVPAFDGQVARMLARLRRLRASAGRAMPRLVTFGLPVDRLASAAPDMADDLAVLGLDGPPDVVAREIEWCEGRASFSAVADGEAYPRISLRIPGRHNLVNALAAIACTHWNGADPAAAARALSAFRGADGRYSIRGTFRGATVVTDYAHHPAAVRATLSAAAETSHGRTWVVFQPLTYSRTRVLFDDFVDALAGCEDVMLAEIFSDRETDPGDMSSRMLADAINARGGRALFFEQVGGIRDRLAERVAPGDLILVLGPEDIRSLGDRLAAEGD